jgi:hypothetical protein
LERTQADLQSMKAKYESLVRKLRDKVRLK